MADPTESKTTPPAIIAPATPPPAAPPPAAPPSAQAPPINQAAPPAPPPPPAGPHAHTLGEDGDIPDNADLIQLPKAALAKRLERHTRKELKDRFGTDNPDEIKVRLDKLAEYERTAEEQRLAGLSEADRLKEQVAKERQRGDQYKQKYQATVEQHVFAREQGRIESIAGQHIDPQFMEYTLQGLARHLQATYSERELKELPDEKIVEYFQKQVQANPKLARDFTAPTPAPRVAPLTNGVRDPARPAPPPGQTPTEKNFSPSAQNAMSRDEARAEARRQGYDY